MTKFLLLQILFAASVELNSILCQYPHQQQQQQQQQHFPSSTNYQIQQHHPISRPQDHNEYRAPSHSLNQDYQPSPAQFDFDKFNQQAQQLQAQVHYFNRQQQKHIQNQINNVHHDGSQPQFDFAINGNYTDLEKASEQFVNLGRLVGKQNVSPKVIKITKTVAVKQQVPVPYPVPVVLKENAPEISHPGFHGHHHRAPSTTEKPSEGFKPSTYFNYSNYVKQQYPTQAPAPTESYHHQQPAQASSEYDTEPFYITTPQKETIKIVPVPYYIDEEGNKHEVSSPSSSHASSTHGVKSEDFYPSRQASSSSDASGKFQSFHFSYHPPTPTHTTHSHATQHYSQQSHSEPDTKYYYNNDDSDNSASSESAPHYASEQSGEQHEHQQHYQYKYVTYE